MINNHLHFFHFAVAFFIFFCCFRFYHFRRFRYRQNSCFFIFQFLQCFFHFLFFDRLDQFIQSEKKKKREINVYY